MSPYDPDELDDCIEADWNDDDLDEEPDPEGQYEQHLADQADADYAALSPWGRLVHDWRNRRDRRRSLKRYRKDAKNRIPDFDTEPPF